jgi:endoglucanase
MFLRVRSGKIAADSGKPVMLQGVNLGGWLMMEGYIMGGRNIPEQEFRRNLASRQGRPALQEFTRLFRHNYIRDIDFKLIKRLGFNCVRIPFNFRLLQDNNGLGYLEKAVAWCKKYRLWAILDLHAAPGSQNEDWHSDSTGRALLWKEKRYQAQFIQIWQFLAERFKRETAVAGYDILNEAVWGDPKTILSVYKKTVKAIRGVDRNHIIFLGGNKWGQEIEFMGRPWDKNLVYSIHFYAPLEFVFAFIRNLRYPGKMGNVYWSRSRLSQRLNKYRRLQKRWKVPVFVGEFGQNSRCVYCHRELAWLKDSLALFKQSGFHWTYWTWKAIAQGIYPDGIYQYQPNPAWINRQGPVSGWENFYSLWPKQKKEIIASWQTESFTPNQPLITLLKACLK